MSERVIVEINNLSKNFSYQKRTAGFKNWFKPEYINVEAVKNLDLEIMAGEMVAFVGPNGAGKSTIIKMLSGILSPTGGKIKVCGLDPIKQRRQLSYKIGCVFGQRSQLLPNLPLRDSFELFGKMYDLPEKVVEERIQELSDIFSLDNIIDQPVRQLSLGQRMRGEIAASLIHKPTIVFLDEPTIGLDVVAKRMLRKTLINLNKTQNTTIFLTSHDTGDIEALAERTVVIDKGQIIVDSKTNELRNKYLNKRYLKIEFEELPKEITVPGIKITTKGSVVNAVVEMKNHDINDVLKALLALGKVKDIQIQDETLEEVIIEIYKSTEKKHEKPE